MNMDADIQILACDVCGRPVRGANEDDRLSYCSTCHRFACSLCWVPGRDICRFCLHAGVSEPRLSPHFGDPFLPSEVIPPGIAPPAEQVASLPPIEGHQVGAGRTRRGGLLWPVAGVVVLLAMVAVGASLGGSLGDTATGSLEPTPSATREGVLGGATSAEPVPSAPTPSPTPLPETYTVEPGDTLLGIARKVYGDEAGWERIYEANRAELPDPNRLLIGQVLRIPRP